MNVRVITVRTEHAVRIMWPDTHASVLRATGEPLYITVKFTSFHSHAYLIYKTNIKYIKLEVY